MIYFLLLLILSTLAIWLFMQLPQFGKVPDKTRLDRIKKSPNYGKDSFQNQSHTPSLAEGTSPWDILKAYFNLPKDREPGQPIPSVKTDLKTISADVPTLIWFGHSSYLILLEGKTILVDPVFSGNASPVAFFGKNYEGSNVYTVDDLPDIDILLITHDHYDHLDYPTVKKLRPKVKEVITSLGVGAHLERWGYEAGMIQELEWGEAARQLGTLTLTALPARHFSGRGLKRNQTHWSSFVLQATHHTLYLGGDSGYDSHFKKIGDEYGPFDLAILECGQYNEFWKYIHLLPEQTVQAALDLRAKTLLPVHSSKFSLALHPWHEPLERVSQEAQKLNLSVTTPLIGQPVRVGKDYPNEKWWR